MEIDGVNHKKRAMKGVDQIYIWYFFILLCCKEGLLPMMVFFSYPLCAFIVFFFLTILTGGWFFIYFHKLIIYFFVGWLVFIRFHLVDPLASLWLPFKQSVKSQVLAFISIVCFDYIFANMGYAHENSNQVIENLILVLISVLINFVACFISEKSRDR